MTWMLLAPSRCRAVSLGMALLAITVGEVRAEARKGVYRYVGKEGVVTLTNKPRGGRGAPASPKASMPSAAAVDAYALAKAEARAQYEVFLAEACELYKIPVALARAVIHAESAFNPFAVSPKGAMGLMQLMPGTATELFVDDAFDPRQNIHGGVRYLRVLANQFDGDITRMVAAYNAGPAAVIRAGGIPNFAETQEYVRRVFQYYFAYKEGVAS